MKHNLLRRAAGVFLAVAAVTGAVAAGGAAASASTVPVTSWETAGWSHPAVRPPVIYVGEGGSPFVAQLHWTHWTGTTAWASGNLWTIKPDCFPEYQCPYYHRWVAVALSRPVQHGARRWYSQMTWRFTKGGRRHVWYWTLRAGDWSGPNI